MVRNEITHTLYFNVIGRTLFALKEILALLTKEKLFTKSILLEGYDLYNPTSAYKQGTHELMWPKSPLVELHPSKVSKEFLTKISLSYSLSYQNDPLNIDKEYVWEQHVKEFKEAYFDQNDHIIEDKIINFRKDKSSTANILVDHFEVLNDEFGYFKSYLKSIDLVMEYHRFSNFIDHHILGAISESYAGNIHTPVYRGQRLSDRIIYLASVMSEIKKHIPLSTEKRNVIVDIGGGFGHMGRFTSTYIPNSCYILVELNEMACFGAYFLQYTFPDKKVATYLDIAQRVDEFPKLVKEYDFIILPTWCIQSLPNEFVDLYIATGSIAEMPKQYAQMYLDEIDRTLKYNGYFYSNSRVKVEKEKIYLYIFYYWQFKSNFLTLSYCYHPVNLIVQTSPQWIGQKIR
ncbi:MAG: putative sugar O-methyltransferase [Epsilonproteobacteria bacterium]|nr:putative sugar O-methyltransferase [Campylobacterota bacterium]